MSPSSLGPALLLALLARVAGAGPLDLGRLDILDRLQPAELGDESPEPRTAPPPSPTPAPDPLPLYGDPLELPDVVPLPLPAGEAAAALVARRRAHFDEVSGLARTPDGRLLASTAQDGRLRLWDQDLTPLAEWTDPQGSLAGVALSPDGTRVFACTRKSGGTSQLLAYEEGELRPLRSFPEGGGIFRTPAFHPGGAMVAVGGGQGAVVYELATARELARLELGDAVYPAAFTPDGAHLVLGGDEGWVEYWEVATWTRRARYQLPEVRGRHGGGLRELVFRHGGAWLDVQTDSQGASLELATGNWSAHEDWKGYALAARPDGRVLAVAPWGGEVRLVDPVRGSPLATLVGHRTSVEKMLFSPDGAHLYAGDDGGGLARWKVAETGALFGLGGRAPVVKVPPFAGLADPAADLPTRDLAQLSPGSWTKDYGSAKGVVASPDGRWVAVADVHRVRVLDARSGTEVARRAHSVSDSRRVQAFSADGQRLAMADESAVVVLGLPGGEEVLTLDPDGAWLAAVALSPDGGLVAGSDGDGEVWVRAVPGGAPVAELVVLPQGSIGSTILADWVSALAFSPDGATLAVATHVGEIHLFDTSAWDQRRILEGHRHAVRDLAYLPDGRLLTAGADGTLRIWPTGGGDPEIRRAHLGGVRCLAVHPGTGRVYSGGSYGRVVLWKPDLSGPAAALQTELRRVDHLAAGPDEWLRIQESGSYDLRLPLAQLGP